MCVGGWVGGWVGEWVDGWGGGMGGGDIRPPSPVTPICKSH